MLFACLRSSTHTRPHCSANHKRLRWIGVGLWVLVACAVRSTRSKRFQQTVCPLHPARLARSIRGKGPGSPKPPKRGEIWAGRLLVSRTGSEVFGICLPKPWNLAPQNRLEVIPVLSRPDPKHANDLDGAGFAGLSLNHF